MLSSALLLSSCTVNDRQRVAAAANSDNPEKALVEFVKDKGREYQQSPGQLAQDIKSLAQLFDDLEGSIRKLWGEQFGTVPGNKKYVKYTNNYQSKAEVDFAKGLVTVETIARDKPLEQLQRAIVVTLLTNDNPADNDIFSDEDPKLTGKPYLFEQVLDHDNKAIAYSWRANRFAEHLIKTQVKTRKIGWRTSHYVEISMVNSHVELRKNQYSEHVLAAANRYQVRPDLIYAIIETESSFNPYAVSRANAYGLMQVVPTTAGKDVYDKVLNKPGMPNKQTLFTPEHNINIGTAYLHLLSDRYLEKIHNSMSRHYAVISAYNGGAGNVYKTFDNNRQAARDIINKLPPSTVYDRLVYAHPRQESRRYLQKVTKALKNY